MDAPNRHTMLDILSALRVAYADLPAAKLAAILPQLALRLQHAGRGSSRNVTSATPI
jgi:hypothetical protein